MEAPLFSTKLNHDVKINMNDYFSHNQVFMALSRAFSEKILDSQANEKGAYHLLILNQVIFNDIQNTDHL